MCCHDCSRRTFLGLTAGMGAGIGLSTMGAGDERPKADWAADAWNPRRPFGVEGKALRVQPILMYRVAERREAASWKSWGGVQTHEAADEEARRIEKELGALAAAAGSTAFEILPVAKVTTAEEGAKVRGGDHDVTVVYPATGSGEVLRACLGEGDRTVIFVRHRSGPVYYWYEALSMKYLAPRNTWAQPAGAPPSPRVCVDDVVVDDMPELAWRLRSFCAVRNFLGARVVALGGAGGKYDNEAPKNARQRYKLDIVEVGYDDLGKRIESVFAQGALVARAEQWTDQYLSLPGTTLATEKKFVINAFLLYGIFKEVLRDCGASIFTINSCMGTILPMSQTTACLTLSLLNDEGILAFCESDFVIIPPGIFLYYIARQPVFLHNSTFPHKGMVTCAHCTSPRRLDGARYEPARILTHYESEFGAAPKVDMPKGQLVTLISPEYSTGRWVGMKGTIQCNPDYEICRSQQDVVIHGDWQRLLNEVRDSHWVMAYNDYLREIAYAARRIGVTWDSLSEVG